MADAKVNTKLKNRKKSALKAARVAERRHVINLRRIRAMKEAVKEVMQVISAKKGSDATKLMPKVFQAVDKAIKGGVIKMNTGARIKARVAKGVKALS
jgi:small subunit ribosomal protein S20